MHRATVSAKVRPSARRLLLLAAEKFEAGATAVAFL